MSVQSDPFRGRAHAEIVDPYVSLAVVLHVGQTSAISRDAGMCIHTLGNGQRAERTRGTRNGESLGHTKPASRAGAVDQRSSGRDRIGGGPGDAAYSPPYPD